MRKKLTLNEALSIVQETAEPVKKLAAENKIVEFLHDHAFHITFNANDLFGWACADSVDVAIEDLPKMLEVYKLFGSAGLDALLALIDQSEVQEPLNTDKYKEAKEYLKDYRPASWVH
jgi:hypothetical protein